MRSFIGSIAPAFRVRKQKGQNRDQSLRFPHVFMPKQGSETGVRVHFRAKTGPESPMSCTRIPQRQSLCPQRLAVISQLDHFFEEIDFLSAR